MSSNHIKNVAIVGAGGRCGSVIVKALLAGGKHTITALTRPNSTSAIPSGVHAVKHVDYDDHASLVSAMKGQDILIITMSVMAPPDSQIKLLNAAIDAEVPWVMPNQWGGGSNGDQELATKVSNDIFFGEGIRKVMGLIKEKGAGKTRRLNVLCGFWYEFSLAGTEARYGFDFDKKELTLYDDGTQRICTTTFPMVGKAVAALLSLPVKSEDGSLCIESFEDGAVQVASFVINQREMFESVLRVTGDKESDWKITHENVEERYKRGLGMMQKGQMLGFGILMYARMFFKDGGGDFSNRLDNERLGLPKENLDEWTKVAVEMAARGENNIIPA